MRADAFVELQRGHDFAPIGADLLAHFGERVGCRHRRNEKKVDRYLGELRAFQAHDKHRATKRCVPGLQLRRERAGRITSSDDEPLRLHCALDRPPKDQRLDLVVEVGGRNLAEFRSELPRVTRRNLAEDDCNRAR